MNVADEPSPGEAIPRNIPTRREASGLLAGLGVAIGTSAIAPLGAASPGTERREIVLDGLWQAGLDRHYDRQLTVPGLATDPAMPTPGTLWYKREVVIPAGGFTHATLTLKGARFAPAVHVDGVKVSEAEGGMAPTEHRFTLPPGIEGRSIVIEIALRSLDALSRDDASSVPDADRWRSNVSSCLWDSVVLRLRGAAEIVRLLPVHDPDADRVTVGWSLSGTQPAGAMLHLSIIDMDGRHIAQASARTGDTASGRTSIALQGRGRTWTPEQPTLYRLQAELAGEGGVVDRRTQTLGLRTFVVDGIDFRLNGVRYPLRMGTVVWHRWTRDPEARTIAFDTEWFERNVVLRLKALGANALRFHLGVPPEPLLDLCDRHGLAVQLEWSFFHGIAASEASLAVQWATWLDVAVRHPSVLILQPWNETDGAPVERAWRALRPLLASRAPMVLCHRDVTPIHKYWWSLFENLGLYYDDAAQFGRAVSADEFGGNYLDGAGNPGSYPTTGEAFRRFLGPTHSRAERLDLHAEANARVAEYWRRLGVAGFSPFCILGSPQDGNHWFLGPTNVPNPAPKPVWAALAAAYAPVSVSLEIWNRNFSPNERIRMPLWFFNDSGSTQAARVRLHVIDTVSGADAVRPIAIMRHLPARSRQMQPVTIALPDRPGTWRLEARLDRGLGAPVLSGWAVRTMVPTVSPRVAAARIGVAEDEIELRAMLVRMGLKPVAPGDAAATVVLGGVATWKRLAEPSGKAWLDGRLRGGCAAVLLDAGPRGLGVGYASGARRGGPLEGAPSVSAPRTLETMTLPGGVTLHFIEAAEPESCLHPPGSDAPLWLSLPHGATRLWNGYRGGLIVPAVDMQVGGLSGKAILAQWQARGADPDRIVAGDYHALELAGYYTFAARPDDAAAVAALRRRLHLLLEDAPSLQGTIDPDGAIVTTDLGAAYRKGSPDGIVRSLETLATAGRGLTRSPVIALGSEDGVGRLLVSQILTAGRLGDPAGDGAAAVYAVRSDPAAVQLVLNMIDTALAG